MCCGQTARVACMLLKQYSAVPTAKKQKPYHTTTCHRCSSSLQSITSIGSASITDPESTMMITSGFQPLPRAHQFTTVPGQSLLPWPIQAGGPLATSCSAPHTGSLSSAAAAVGLTPSSMPACPPSVDFLLRALLVQPMSLEVPRPKKDSMSLMLSSAC